MPTEYFAQNDGQFRVRAFSEPNRHGNVRYRVRYGYRGHPACTESAPSEAAAVRQAEVIWGAHIDGLLDAPVDAPETLEQLVTRFCERKDIAMATEETYRRSINRFVAFVGKDKPLAHIGKGVVARWLASMTCKPVSKASYLRSLSAMFKWAVKQKFVTVDPTREQEIERFRTQIRPWLQFHEWQPFLDACGPHHRLRAEFVLHTGLRAGELARARWSWLHGTVGRRALGVPASKSARDRAIPLSSRAEEVLEQARKVWPPGDDPDARIFGPQHVDNLSGRTNKACKTAQVTVTDFHGLRRSCGARWLEVGVPLLHVSRLLGHADVSTTARHYAGLADGTLAAEIDKVDAANRAQSRIANVVGLPPGPGRLKRV